MTKPIGIFDFGIGGLTVMREVAKALPHESIVFLNDNVHLAAGNDADSVVRKDTIVACEFLLHEDAKAIVIACNTATVVALDLLTQKYPLPVIGVVEPTARAAVRATINRRIGVIGTKMTIRSNAYPKALRTICSDLFVISKACPLLVSMIEEDFTDSEATRIVISEYLKDLHEENIDVLILGCTHYSLIKNMFSSALPKVKLIESGPPTAMEIRHKLEAANTINQGIEPPTYTFYATDLNDQLRSGARYALGGDFGANQPDFKKANLT